MVLRILGNGVGFKWDLQWRDNEMLVMITITKIVNVLSLTSRWRIWQIYIDKDKLVNHNKCCNFSNTAGFLCRTISSVLTHCGLQVLSDRIGLSCSLVRGDYNRAWNEVLLPSTTTRATGLYPHLQTYIIDLMHKPGTLMKCETPAAEQYQTI